MDPSLAARYHKLSADQGHADAQFNYALLLKKGDVIGMDQSLAAHYYKLSADQRHASPRFRCFSFEMIGRSSPIPLK
jgi:TPR repeat protein